MTVNQQDPSERAKPGTVTRVFRSIAPAILWITLANGTVLGTTPDHEVWTHEDGWTSAKRVEVGDSFATRDGACVQVTDLRLDPTPAEVFNLEVTGFYTYYVNNIWVHNNRCDPNKLHHIFGKPSHRLDTLVDALGSPEEAYLAVEEAVLKAASSGAITGIYKTVVHVKGIAVTVTGNVVNGVARIGTFYVK